jgi:hypothetical protein
MIKRIWVIYFLIRLFYMFIAVFVFSKITTLGDTFDYLNTPLFFSFKIFYSSTIMMQFLGALFKKIFVMDVLACFPFMLLSFYGVYYAVKKLDLYPYATYILILFSLPNFGIWTSILGKEAVGSFAMCIIAVMLIKKLNGCYRLKLIDYFAIYLCTLFKPQYLLYIAQAWIFIVIVKNFKDKKIFPLAFGIMIICLNLAALYLMRDIVDFLAKGMAVHFHANDPSLAQSTRSETPWLEPYGFYAHAPYGMLIAFFGPTPAEMLRKPAQMIAGIESLGMFFCFLRLLLPRIKHFSGTFNFNPTVWFVYFVVFAGVLFVHYPFGFLNPGSAIRYRANFYPLFVLMLFNLFIYPKKVRLRIDYKHFDNFLPLN